MSSFVSFEQSETSSFSTRRCECFQTSLLILGKKESVYFPKMSNYPFKFLWLSCRHKEAYTWTNPMCCVHNIILGKLWIEQYGTVEIINHRYMDKWWELCWLLQDSLLLTCCFSCMWFISTGDKCVLNFKPCGMFGKELHKVEGHIQDKR